MGGVVPEPAPERLLQGGAGAPWLLVFGTKQEWAQLQACEFFGQRFDLWLRDSTASQAELDLAK